MKGHNLSFYLELRKLSQNYPVNAALSGTLVYCYAGPAPLLVSMQGLKSFFHIFLLKI